MDRLFHTGRAGGGREAGVPGRPVLSLTPRAPSCGEAVLIVDVDQFAAIRAAHGPHACEQVTRAVADCLRRRLRPGDRLALLRAEEFLAVLPGTCGSALPTIEARLRAGVASLRLALAGSVWTLSCTTGGAARATQPSSLDSLVRAADTALYHARHPQDVGPRSV